MRSLADAFKESAEAVQAGKYDKALESLIWIHDNPNPAEPYSEIFRRAYGFLTLGVLAGVYAPAKKALIELVTKKRGQVAAGLAEATTEADLRALEAAMPQTSEPFAAMPGSNSWNALSLRNMTLSPSHSKRFPRTRKQSVGRWTTK